MDFDQLLKMLQSQGSDLLKAGLDYALFRHRRPLAGAAREAFDRIVHDSPARDAALKLYDQGVKAISAFIVALGWTIRGLFIGLVAGVISLVLQKLEFPTGAEVMIWIGYGAIAIPFLFASVLMLAQFVKIDLIQKALAFITLIGDYGVEMALRLLPEIIREKKEGHSEMVLTAKRNADGFMRHVAAALFWFTVFMMFTLAFKVYVNPLLFVTLAIAACALFYRKRAWSPDPRLYRWIAGAFVMQVVSTVAYKANEKMIDTYFCTAVPGVCEWGANQQVANNIREMLAPVKEKALTKRFAGAAKEVDKLMTDISALESKEAPTAADLEAIALKKQLVDWNLTGREGPDPRAALVAVEAKKTAPIAEKQKASCEDGLDNDGDKLIDRQDTDCYSPDDTCAQGKADCKGFPARYGQTIWRRYVSTLDEKPAVVPAAGPTTQAAPSTAPTTRRAARRRTAPAPVATADDRLRNAALAMKRAMAAQ